MSTRMMCQERTNCCPLISLLAPLNKNRYGATTSSGFGYTLRFSAGKACIRMRELTTPGSTLFTRIDVFSSSSASIFIMPSLACLETRYAPQLALALVETSQLLNTMDAFADCLNNGRQ